MSNELQALVEQGLEAIRRDDLDTATSALAAAREAGGQEDGRVLHLAGLVGWIEGNLEEAASKLLEAVEAAPANAMIQLDAAEFLFVEGELEEAEKILRDFLDRESADEGRDDARMLLAQLRLEDDDAEEALEILDTVEGSKEQVEYLVSRGGVLFALGRNDESIDMLSKATDSEPEDADLHYQLGVVLRASGRMDDACAQMVKVLELDSAQRESSSEAPDSVVQRDLRERFEAILEEIPESIMKRLAGAPIKVERVPTKSQVEEGVDPRNAVAFVGDAVGPTEEGALEQIVIMRDLLVDALDEQDEMSEEEQIEEVLFESTLVELRRFFALEELVVAGVGG
jgi:tetratricopeptide (TPR) repeat protein